MIGGSGEEHERTGGSVAIASRRRRFRRVILSTMTATTIIGFLIVMSIPDLNRSRDDALAAQCRENLIKIEGAVAQWAVEHDKTDGATCIWADLVGENLYLKKTPTCPQGGQYLGVLTVGTTVTCSICGPLP